MGLVMSYRKELRHYTQVAYGFYCSYVRKRNRNPMPYHQFSVLHSRGQSIKEIHELESKLERGNF